MNGRSRVEANGGRRVDLSDHREIGGVWVPHRVERRFTCDGHVDSSEVAVVSFEVDGESSDRTFEKIFPAGLVVHDRLRGGQVAVRIDANGEEIDFEPDTLDR